MLGPKSVESKTIVKQIYIVMTKYKEDDWEPVLPFDDRPPFHILDFYQTMCESLSFEHFTFAAPAAFILPTNK